MTSAQAVRRIAREWVPPALLSLWRRARATAADASTPRLPEWECLGTGWPEKSPDRGWRDGAIAARYASHWPEFLALMQGDGPLAVSHEKTDLRDLCVDGQTHWLTLAYVASREVRRCGGSVSVLDLGGALGHTRIGLEALFPEIRWSYFCAEVPSVCERGRDLHPQAVFIDDDSWQGRRFDLVIASNVLHYFPDWQGALTALSQATTGSLWLSRVPTVSSSAFTFLQRHFAYGLPTEVVSWAFHEAEFLKACAATRLSLRRRFLVFSGVTPIPGAPEPPLYKGFLFDRV